MWKLRLRFEATLWLRAAVDYLKLSKTESMLLPWKWVSNHIKRLRFIYLFFFNFTITTFIFIQQWIQVHPKASCAFAPLSLDSFVALQKKIENWKSHLAKRFSSCADVRLIIKWCDSTLPGDHVQTRIPRSVWRRARPQRMHVSEISICL